MELAVTLCNGTVIEPADLVLDPGSPASFVSGEELTMRDYEMKIIKAYLAKYKNDIRLVAEKLDIGVSTIYRLMKEDKSK
jgi:DNA-binding NtrC family response regulator